MCRIDLGLLYFISFFQEKFDEMKKNISEYELELRTVKSAKEYAETKVSKYLQSHEDTETNITSLKETIIKKEKEIRVSLMKFLNLYLM